MTGINAKRGARAPSQQETDGAPPDPNLLSGLDYLRAWLVGEVPPPPIGTALDFVAIAFGPGEATFEGRPDGRFLNPLGTVHGGYAATLLDSCMGCAVHSLLARGEGFTTVELKVCYVRAITGETGLVRAAGRALHRDRRMAFAEGRLVDTSDRLLAHATTSCMILPAAARSPAAPDAPV